EDSPQRKAPARRAAGAKVSHIREVMEHLALLFRPNARRGVNPRGGTKRPTKAFAIVARAFTLSPSPAPKALAHGPWQWLPPAGVARTENPSHRSWKTSQVPLRIWVAARNCLPA